MAGTLPKPRVLLVGPRVARLANFFEDRGYKTDATELGESGLKSLADEPIDVALFELEMGDLLARDFIKAARKVREECSFVLMEDPAKAHRIIAAMVQGISNYIATPPDEEAVFRLVDRLAASTQSAAGSEALKMRILELEAELARAKPKKRNNAGNGEDPTGDVFADATLFSEDASEESVEIEIAIPVHDDNERSKRLDAEFEEVKNQMPAQARVRGTDAYRKIVESVWSGD